MSSSKFVTEELLRDSFGYHGKVLEYGMPRNAILLKPHNDILSKVYHYFDILRDQNTSLVLYAPTFRGDFRNSSFLDEEQQFNIDDCLNALNMRFNKKFIFLFRAHHTMKNVILGNNYILATDYPDMQELICAADVLITDYSSCMGDMALMKKPIFLYAPDVEDYIKDRGLYWDINLLPFPLSRTKGDFIKSILEFDQESYVIDINNYLLRLGCYESPESVKKTVEWLFSVKTNNSLFKIFKTIRNFSFFGIKKKNRS